MILKNPLRGKNRTFLSWLASYAVILIIPILIGVFAYDQSIQIIHEEVNKVHDSSLRQFKTAIDGRLTEIGRISNEILLNERIKIFMGMEPPLSPQEMYSVKEIQNLLSKFEVSNTNISSICIYFKKNNFFLTSEYIYRENKFSEIGKKSFGMEQASMLELVNLPQSRNYRVLGSTPVNGRVSNKVAFIQSITGSDLKKPLATLVIFLDGDKLNGLMQNLTWTTKGLLAIINKQDEVISSRDMGELPDYLKYEGLKQAGSLFYAGSSKELVVTQKASEVNDWRYVSVIPSKAFLQKVEYIRIMIFIYIGLCLLIGGFAAFFLTKRNYSPLKKLTQLLKGNVGNGEKPEEDKDEFRYMERTFRKLLDEKESFKSRLRQQNEAMRGNFLTKLLKGRLLNTEAVMQTAAGYDIHFPDNSFLVMIFHVEDDSRLFLEEKGKDGENALDMAFFIIRNIVEELVGEKFPGYMTEVDGRMACIVNVSGTSDDASVQQKNEVMSIAENAKSFMDCKMGLQLSVGLSDIHPSVSGISKAYYEAIEAVEYMALVGEASAVVAFSDISNHGMGGFNISYTVEREKQFYNCILAEDFNGARTIVSEIIASDFTRGEKSLQLAKFRMFGLINTMLNAIGEMRTTQDMKLMDELERVNRLISSRSVTELQNQMNEIFDKLNESHAAKKQTAVPEWMGEVLDYLDKHYYEAELSAGVISEKFSVHLSSLSRLFKKHMGVGLLDYIHKKRLEKAKELMKLPGINIKDIAEKVGYYSSLTMIRAFKRYEGTTPGRFKEKE